MDENLAVTKDQCVTAVDHDGFTHYYHPQTGEEIFDPEYLEDDGDGSDEERERIKDELKKEKDKEEPNKTGENGEPSQPEAESNPAGDTPPGETPTPKTPTGEVPTPTPTPAAPPAAPPVAPPPGGELAVGTAPEWLVPVLIVLAVLFVIIVIVVIVYLVLMAKPESAFGDCSSGGSTTIVLDPGHISESQVKDDGSAVSGNWGNTGGEGIITERHKNLEIANALKPKLEAKGYNVLVTRTDPDGKLSNKERIEMANNANAALFLSLHHDDRSDGSRVGYFFMYPDKTGNINNAGKVTGPTKDVQNKSKAAAEALSSAVYKKIGLSAGKNNGIQPESKNGGNADNGGLLVKSVLAKVPIVTAEFGNVKNPEEANWLKSKANINTLADALANGVAAFAPPTAKSSGSASFLFPIKGSQKSYSGRTAGTAPDRAGAYVIAKESDQYYEWPTPDPSRPYEKYKGQANVSPNQEPGYYACRPTSDLPNGCGRPHKGVDIYAAYGTPVLAPENGSLISYGGSDVKTPAGHESSNGGTGRWISLNGASGNKYTFMHLMGFSDQVLKTAGIDKEFGDTSAKSISVPVKAGDVIAYVGRTGGIINPHLHLAVEKNGKDLNPAAILTIGGADASCTGLSGPVAQKAIALAKQQLGKPYLWAAPDRGWKDKNPSSFDCSGLVGWAYYWATDGKYSMNGQTDSDYGDSSKLTHITQGEAVPGDLIYWTEGNIHHVGIFLGNGEYIHAPRTGDVVKISKLADRSEKPLFARPIIK